MMSSPNTFTLKLPSNRKNIHRVEDFFRTVNAIYHLSDEKFYALLVAVTEAVNNSIIHGNKNDASKNVMIRCSKTKNVITVRVTDEGEGFVPDKIASPIEDQNILRISGRGVFLMKAFMHSVKYNAKGNEVTMTMIADK